MINPLTAQPPRESGGVTQGTAQPSPDLVERLEAAMNATPEADPCVMQEFQTRFEKQLVDQTIRDMQKLTRKLTGKE